MSAAEKIMFPVPRIAFRAVTIAMDISPVSERSFQFASEIARRYAATLLIAYIVPAGQVVDYPREVEELKERLGKRLLQGVGGELPDIRQEVLIQHCAPCPLLIRYSSQNNADLIVLGTRDPSFPPFNQ